MVIAIAILYVMRPIRIREEVKAELRAIELTIQEAVKDQPYEQSMADAHKMFEAIDGAVVRVEMNGELNQLLRKSGIDSSVEETVWTYRGFRITPGWSFMSPDITKGRFEILLTDKRFNGEQL